MQRLKKALTHNSSIGLCEKSRLCELRSQKNGNGGGGAVWHTRWADSAGDAFDGSDAFDHSRKQQRAARQFGNDDVLVGRVRALADATHAVEGGNAHAGGEVSVGASANGGFFEFPSCFAREVPGLLVERRDSCGALHREAVDGARDLELAVFVEKL